MKDGIGVTFFSFKTHVNTGHPIQTKNKIIDTFEANTCHCYMQNTN